MKFLPFVLSLFIVLPLAQEVCQGGEEGTPNLEENNPHLPQRCEVKNSTVTFRVSGVLQPDDSQFVHDLSCEELGTKMGSVRMRWAHKYGHRYGGVGIVFEGGLEEAWRGDNGWITVKIPELSECEHVVVTPRLAKILD